MSNTPRVFHWASMARGWTQRSIFCNWRTCCCCSGGRVLNCSGVRFLTCCSKADSISGESWTCRRRSVRNSEFTWHSRLSSREYMTLKSGGNLGTSCQSGPYTSSDAVVRKEVNSLDSGWIGLALNVCFTYPVSHFWYVKQTYRKNLKIISLTASELVSG